MQSGARVRVVVATHGHCFDGAAAAAVFSRLYERLHAGRAIEFTYRACDYGPGDSSVPAGWLRGDDNVILDFRYSAAPTLTWYFDHHATAFATADDRAAFERGLPARGYHDATYSSCTRLIADVARERLGVELPELSDLVRWADRIDAARFASADEAVARAAPELELMTVIEHHGDDRLLAELVPQLATRPLAEVARSSLVHERFGPLAERRARVIERMRARGRCEGLVAFCDLSDEPLEIAEKFAMYALFPASTYSVVLTRTPSRVKVSVGYNPWCSAARTHDIGQICARYGGGGHPVVGAITLGASEGERARAICARLLEELAS